MAKKIKKFKDQQVIDKLKELVEHYLVPINDITSDVTIEIKEGNYNGDQIYLYKISIENEDSTPEQQSDLISEISEFYSFFSKNYQIDFDLFVNTNIYDNSLKCEINIDYSNQLTHNIKELVEKYEHTHNKIWLDKISNMFNNFCNMDPSDGGWALSKAIFTIPKEEKYISSLLKTTRDLKNYLEIKDSGNDYEVSMPKSKRIYVKDKDYFDFMYNFYKKNNLI